MRCFVHKATEINGLKVFIDVGCGKGEGAQVFCDKTFGTICVGLEINRQVLRNMKRKRKSDVHLVCASALNLPFAKECADFVVCSHVIEHVLNDQTVLEEIRKILKSDGLVFLSAPKDFGSFLPFYIPLCYYTGRDADHVRNGYNVKQLKKRLSQSGFSILHQIVRPQIFWIGYWYLTSAVIIIRSVFALSLLMEEPMFLQNLKRHLTHIDTLLPEWQYLDPGFRFILTKL